jgi:hypothetical protein
MMRRIFGGASMPKRKFYAQLDLRRAMLMAAPFCAVFAAQKAHAVDHNPTDLATLRTALIAVNGATTNDRIFLPAGTITLNAGALEDANVSGDLDITKGTGTLEIIGAGQTSTILDGGDFDRVLHIDANSAVTIRDLTIRNGMAFDDGATFGPASGGGILHVGSGSLALNNVTITANEASASSGSSGSTSGSGSSGFQAEGGGLFLDGGAVTITACTISSNIARGGNGGDGGSADSASGGTSVFGNTGGSGGSGGDAYGGAMTTSGTVTITGSTITGNSAIGGVGGAGGNGGDAAAFATSTSSVLAVGGLGGSGGSGGWGLGGGINVNGGSVSITTSCIDNNSAAGGAGGIGGLGGTGFASGSAFSSSTGVGGNGGAGGVGGAANGGGVYMDATALDIVNSTVSGNTTSGGAGGNGGVGGDGVGGTFTVAGSGGDGGDGGSGEGGGVYLDFGTLDLSNSTLAFHTAGGGAGGQGGAPGPGGTASSSGIDGLTSAGAGGGVFVGGGTFTLDSSIVADNTASTGPNISGAVTADAGLIENTTGAVVTAGPNGNLTGDPGLSALALNNGTTRNHRIAENSIARNTGSNPLLLAGDQRGQARDDGNGVDIGAFEFNPIDVIGGGDGDGTGDEGCTTTTQSGRMWLMAPVLAVIALFRRRRSPAKARQRS